jgi:predicted ferric reductase
MTANMRFTEPNKKVRLGFRKIIKVQRGQDFVEALAWLSVVAVVSMFLLDGNLAQIKLDDATTWLNAISRLTALVATDILLIHMLLVARVPWIDRLYGHDRATLTHKKLGKPILYLVIAHFLASLISYAISAKTTIVNEFFTLLLHSGRDLLWSILALALMIVVVVSSINIARKRLSYEAWYLVHLLSYFSVALAVPHQFSTGTDIAGKWPQTFFWVTLYLFVVCNIAWFRFLAPIVGSIYHGFKVVETASESSDATSIYIGGRNLKRVGGKAGQFYILRVMTAKEWWRAHPFSLSAAPNENFIRFTIGKRGDDTSLLQLIKPGTRIILEGPYGVFTEDRRTREKVTLIAAGIGAPPIRALAESMAARPGDINIIYRVRNESDAPLVEELKELSRRRGFKLTLLEGSRGNPKSWMPAHPENLPDHARLSLIAPWVSESDVFICGPAPWTKTVEKSLLRAGTPSHQIHAEEFAW